MEFYLPHWSTQIESAKIHLVLSCLANMEFYLPHWSTQIESAKIHLVLSCLANMEFYLPHWSTQIESAKIHLVLSCLATKSPTPELWLMSRHLRSKDTSPRSAALS